MEKLKFIGIMIMIFLIQMILFMLVERTIYFRIMIITVSLITAIFYFFKKSKLKETFCFTNEELYKKILITWLSLFIISFYTPIFSWISKILSNLSGINFEVSYYYISFILLFEMIGILALDIIWEAVKKIPNLKVSNIINKKNLKIISIVTLFFLIQVFSFFIGTKKPFFEFLMYVTPLITMVLFVWKQKKFKSFYNIDNENFNILVFVTWIILCVIIFLILTFSRNALVLNYTGKFSFDFLHLVMPILLGGEIVIILLLDAIWITIKESFIFYFNSIKNKEKRNFINSIIVIFLIQIISFALVKFLFFNMLSRVLPFVIIILYFYKKEKIKEKCNLSNQEFKKTIKITWTTLSIFIWFIIKFLIVTEILYSSGGSILDDIMFSFLPYVVTLFLIIEMLVVLGLDGIKNFYKEIKDEQIQIKKDKKK